MRYLLSMDAHTRNVLSGLLWSTVTDADRDGRDGPWVDTIRELAKACGALDDQHTGPNRSGRVVGGELQDRSS